MTDLNTCRNILVKIDWPHNTKNGQTIYVYINDLTRHQCFMIRDTLACMIELQSSIDNNTVHVRGNSPLSDYGPYVEQQCVMMHNALSCMIESHSPLRDYGHYIEHCIRTVNDNNVYTPSPCVHVDVDHFGCTPFALPVAHHVAPTYGSMFGHVYGGTYASSRRRSIHRR